MEPGRFEGKIGRYHDESTPWWPDPVRPPEGGPNVVYVVLDDVGFAQLGCFGSDLDTPVMDGLGSGGLRYSNFHTTALCSPTRSCLLTGRNHHSNSMGRITDLAMGFPGYDARVPKANGFLSEILVRQGYAAWAVGKWHLTPMEEAHLAAPRDRWPLSRGFERFYGFFEGETHQFAPSLVYDSHQIDPPRSVEDGYHLTEDLVDRAIEFTHDLRAVDADKPFFLYLCPGACHSPHHAPQRWLDHYRGRFDEGWDVWRDAALDRQIASGVMAPGTRLSPRPDWVPAWDSLDDDTRRVYARFMEAFAAMLSHADEQLGRYFDALADLGELDQTMVFLVSDNGASSEGGPVGSLNDARQWNFAGQSVEQAVEHIDDIGGPRFHNNYPWGWTIAGNTPFRRWKREVHEGGVADPMIVHWPAGISSRGEVRTQYVHAIDLLPTVLEVLGLDAPEFIDGVPQRPIEGTSFSYTFDGADEPERHETQYYEMLGCRAIYHEGWKAVTYHPVQDETSHLSDDAWELYDLGADPTECDDLAASHPDRLRDLVERWWVEAARHQVLPLDNRPFSEQVLERPPAVPPRRTYVFHPGTASVPEPVAVNVRNRTHRITADIDIGPELASDGAEGVLLAMGSVLGGFTFFLQRGRLIYAHNWVGLSESRVAGDVRLAPGPHRLVFAYSKTGEFRGTGTLLVDDEVVGQGEIPIFTASRFTLTGDGLTCGRDPAMAVVDDYEAPFPFAGTLHRVTVEVDGEPYVDPEAEADAAIASQ